MSRERICFLMASALLTIGYFVCIGIAGVSLPFIADDSDSDSDYIDDDSGGEGTILANTYVAYDLEPEGQQVRVRTYHWGRAEGPSGARCKREWQNGLGFGDEALVDLDYGTWEDDQLYDTLQNRNNPKQSHHVYTAIRSETHDQDGDDDTSKASLFPKW